jgi:hypothetical protein
MIFLKEKESRIKETETTSKRRRIEVLEVSLRYDFFSISLDIRKQGIIPRKKAPVN